MLPADRVVASHAGGCITAWSIALVGCKVRTVSYGVLVVEILSVFPLAKRQPQVTLPVTGNPCPVSAYTAYT